MRSFQIQVDWKQLHDLTQRLSRTRFPDGVFRNGDEDGASLPLVQRMLDHWQNSFDWRAQEKRLNRLPQFVTEIDGIDIHFVYRKGNGPSPVPLILTHGWPGSFVEFEAAIPLLADPGSYGGDPADAFDVIVPSMPGFGFSSAPSQPGTGSREIARLWSILMGRLGYTRYFAQGGDIGAGVSTWLAIQYPEQVQGVHLNYVPGSFRPPFEAGTRFEPDEEAFLDRIQKFAAAEGAYSALQATKPQTLAYSLSDSPAGLAAWIGEKFDSWVDHQHGLEGAVSLDKLLTNISIYWFGNNVNASLRVYKENRLQPLDLSQLPRPNVPFAIAHFPKELPTPPRKWVERGLTVVRWTEMPRGGHFAALEQPELLVDDIRAAFRSLR